MSPDLKYMFQAFIFQKRVYTLIRWIGCLSVLVFGGGEMLGQIGKISPAGFKLEGVEYKLKFDDTNLGQSRNRMKFDEGETYAFTFRVTVEPRPESGKEFFIRYSSNSQSLSFDNPRVLDIRKVTATLDLSNWDRKSVAINILVTNKADSLLSRHTLPLTITRTTPTSSSANCNEKSGEEKLACLDKVNKGLSSGQEKVEVLKQIEDLRAEKNEIVRSLENLTPKYATSSSEVSLLLRNADEYEVESNSSNLSLIESNKDEFRFRATDYGSFEVEIRHKIWRDAKKTESITFKEAGPNGRSPQQNSNTDQGGDSSQEGNSSPEGDSTQMKDSTKMRDSAETVIIPDQDSTAGPKEDPDPPKTFDLIKEAEKLYENYPLYVQIGGGALILLLIVFFFISRNRKKKRKKASSNIETLEAGVNKQASQEQESKSESTSTEVQDTKQASPPENQDLDIGDDFDIVIKEQEKPAEEEIDKLSLEELSNHLEYLPIELEACWRDTSVRNIFMRESSISAIFDHVKKENKYLPQSEMIEDVPEIGGFLLGHVYPLDDERFDISFEKFVPIVAESQNRYTVKFGDIAWSQLDDELKAQPGIKLVGWFHTHPGHGLFLSEADLREQHSLFKEPYQVAMEIDPSTQKYDTAFFTWQHTTKEMNNVDDRLQEEWWHISEFEQALRDRAFNQSEE